MASNGANSASRLSAADVVADVLCFVQVNVNSSTVGDPGVAEEPISWDGVVFHDFVGDTFGDVFSGDFLDGKFTCGDDDGYAAGLVLKNDSCHGVTSAENGDIAEL
jgi:hypothetical protein